MKSRGYTDTYIEMVFNVVMWTLVLLLIGLRDGFDRCGPVLDACSGEQ